MFPDADDYPALPFQLAIDGAVSRGVFPNLLVPKGLIRFGTSITLRAPVPKATIDEEGDPFRLKKENPGDQT